MSCEEAYYDDPYCIEEANEDWNYEVWNKKKKRLKRREDNKKAEGYKKKLIGLEKELKYISGKEECYKALSSGKDYIRKNIHIKIIGKYSESFCNDRCRVWIKYNGLHATGYYDKTDYSTYRFFNNASHNRFWKVRITNIKLSKDEYNKLFQSMIYPNSGKVGKSIANRRIRRFNDSDGEYPIAPNRRYINSRFAYSLWDWEW